MKLLIIRHGDPDYENDCLTPKGVVEAELLSRRLMSAGITKIYCSPMGRARQTAQPTCEALGQKPEIKEFLREYPASIRCPKTGENICPWVLAPEYWTDDERVYHRTDWMKVPLYAESRVPAVYAEITEGADGLIAQHGYRRDGSAWRIERKNSDVIALFCHFGLGMALTGHLLGISTPLLWGRGHLPTSSVTTVAFWESSPGQADVRCTAVGDTSHLYGAEKV